MVGKKYMDTSWDFRNNHQKYATHSYHTYPAMMIPQIARRLLETYGKNAEVSLDPFMGSGTALVESTLHSNFKTAYGIDINPLARLISKVKTTAIEPIVLESEYEKLIQRIEKTKKTEIPSFSNIEFWFKPRAIKELAIIRENIEQIENQAVQDFFWVVFSEVVRKTSNTRSGEYKLYRIAEKKLTDHNPTPILEFMKKARQNILHMHNYFKERTDCKTIILDEDSRKKTSIANKEVDIIVTSPPYGDSRTTVAYGQFSRLALQWIGKNGETVKNIDKNSLGGIPVESLENNLNSPALAKTISHIAKIDEDRVKDVLSFYVDFNKCVVEIDRVLKGDGHVCLVVGNRTVKGIKIPTDEILIDLFQTIGDYVHKNTFIRNIPSKRIPKKSSPTNIKGKTVSTMNEEYVVVLQKD